MFGINEVNKMEQFVRDCLSRKMSLQDVATKWNIEIEDILYAYQQAKSTFTKEEIEKIMNEVYYEN